MEIYDEVDALMTAKKSFVYSIGNSSPLPNARMRFEFTITVIEIILKEIFPKEFGK